MNFICTFLILYCLGPLVGLGSFFGDWSPVISQSFVGTPAARAGVAPGDRFVEVDGKAVGTFLEAYHAIGKHPGTPFELTWTDRAGNRQSKEVIPNLLVGNETYGVDESGELTLKSSAKQKDLKDLKVEGISRDQLVELAREKVGDKEEPSSYEVKLEGQESVTVFELPKPERYRGPRGQVGVQFGVNDIHFEKDLKGVVSEIQDGSLASTMGIQPGDQILAVAGLRVFGGNPEVRYFGYGSRVDEALRVASSIEEIETLDISVLRNGEPKYLELPKPEGPLSLESFGLKLEPITTSDILAEPFRMIGSTLYQPVFIFKLWMSSRVSAGEIAQNLQGPVGIMQLLFNLSDNGILQFLFFVALLNAAIGAFNLLPFPALDGSRLVFLVIEGIRGKPVDPDKEAKIHMLGLMILLSFVVIVSVGDIRRLFSSNIFVL